MCVLAAEILMLVGGLYALVAGKVRLTGNMYLEGKRARVAGLFLAAPLPLAFLAGLFIAMLISMGALPASAESAAGIVELLLVLGGLAGAVVFALATKPKEPKSSIREGQRSEDLEELVQGQEEGLGTHELTEEKSKPDEAEQQPSNGPKANRRAALAIIVGLVLIVAGIVLVAMLFLAFNRSAADAEYSYETVVAGPHEEHVLEIEVQEGRYDWSISSNNQPFDAYLVLREHFPAYKAGEEFPRVEEVKNVTYWTPFLQTGGGMFGLAIVNPGEQELYVRVQTTFRYNPPFSVFCLPPMGLIVAFGGLLLVIVGIVWRIRRK